MSRAICGICMCLEDEHGCGCSEYKPLMETDVPFQKAAPKEVAQEINKALELNAGGEPVKNATYWKRQYDKAQDEMKALRADEKRLDWIWHQAQKENGGVFEIKGVELFTVATQHMKDVYGIRSMIDAAMKIEWHWDPKRKPKSANPT